MLRYDVALHYRIDGGVHAAGPGCVTDAAGKVQLHGGRALVGGSEFEVHGEMAAAPRHKVSQPDKKLGRGRIEPERRRSVGGIRRVAEIGHASERERLAAGNVCGGRAAVAVVQQQTRAQVQWTKHVKIGVDGCRAQGQTAVVMNSAVVEIPAVAEIVEAGADVDARSHVERGFDSRAQRRHFELHSGPVGPTFVLRRVLCHILRPGAGSKIKIPSPILKFIEWPP